MPLGFSGIESLESTHQPKTLLTKISNQWVSCILFISPQISSWSKLNTWFFHVLFSGLHKLNIKDTSCLITIISRMIVTISIVYGSFFYCLSLFWSQKLIPRASTGQCYAECRSPPFCTITWFSYANYKAKIPSFLAFDLPCSFLLMLLFQRC